MLNSPYNVFTALVLQAVREILARLLFNRCGAVPSVNTLASRLYCLFHQCLFRNLILLFSFLIDGNLENPPMPSLEELYSARVVPRHPVKVSQGNLSTRSIFILPTSQNRHSSQERCILFVGGMMLPPLLKTSSLSCLQPLRGKIVLHSTYFT